MSIQFSEMDIIDDINESDFGWNQGIKGQIEVNTEAIGRNLAVEGRKRKCNI